jgi:phosphocarrier protein HPr
MPLVEVEIVNRLGLHARASAKLTQLAGKFHSDIWMSRSGRRVNAKSIMGVMMLAAGKGSMISIEANGNDADQALSELCVLIANKFDEGE